MSESEKSTGVAAVFDRAAPTYDQVGVPWFTPIATRLVEEIEPASGATALDLGCGRGAATFVLAEAVGPGGHVTAVDLAPGMVDALRADVRARGLSQVDVVLADVASADLPGDADVLTASLVLFFLPDPLAALTTWGTLLVPGGRLGISTFGQQDDVWRAVDDLFTPFLPPRMLDARSSGRAGPFASDHGVENLFTSAGLDEIRTESFDLPVVFRDAEQWYDWTWSHGQRAMWEHVPDDRRAEVTASATALLEASRQDGAITMRQRVRCTLGRLPPG